MDILEECDLDQALDSENKNPDEKPPWKTIYELIEYEYFDESRVKPPKQFLTKFKAEYNIPRLIPHEVKKNTQQFGLECGLFSKIARIKIEKVVVFQNSSKAKPKNT